MTFVPSTVDTTAKTEPPFEPFLLNPRNRDFFLGKMPYVPTYVSAKRRAFGKILVYTVGVCFVAIIGAIVTFDLSYPGNDLTAPLLFAIGFLVFLVIFVINLNQKQQRAERESREGKIIQGQLTKIRGESGSENAYSITVWYSFISPLGNTLIGKNSRSRSDLKHHVGLFKDKFDPLPEPGTPVAVIYLDDKHYRML